MFAKEVAPWVGAPYKAGRTNRGDVETHLNPRVATRRRHGPSRGGKMHKTVRGEQERREDEGWPSAHIAAWQMVFEKEL